MAAYIIVVIKDNSMQAYAPFPSERRAKLYVETLHKCGADVKWTIKPLTVPFGVVKNIIWR